MLWNGALQVVPLARNGVWYCARQIGLDMLAPAPDTAGFVDEQDAGLLG